MRAAAHQAVELDDESAEAHASLAAYLGIGEWNWDEAEKSFLRAIELDSDYSTAHHSYAFQLEALGRFDEAVIQRQRALELEPLVALYYTGLANSLRHLGRLDRSLERNRQAIELDPGLWTPHESLGKRYEKEGDLKQAIAAFERAVHFSGGLSRPMAGLARVLALAGREKEARRILEELRAATERNDIYTPQVASVLYALDDADAAFEWLEAAYRQRHFDLQHVALDSGAAGLQDDPRFKELLQRMDLAM
jgi:tetratricopeptide (TPR) repeat protein